MFWYVISSSGVSWLLRIIFVLNWSFTSILFLDKHLKMFLVSTFNSMPLHFIKVGQCFGTSLLNIKCSISNDLGYCVPCDIDVRCWFCFTV